VLRIRTIEEVDQIAGVTEALRSHIKEYCNNLLEEYNITDLAEVGEILVVQGKESIHVLAEIGLLQDKEQALASLPEFAEIIQVGEQQLLRIIWVCSDCFGYIMYYKPHAFGETFDQWLQEYLVE
jgi:hypothetical protein